MKLFENQLKPEDLPKLEAEDRGVESVLRGLKEMPTTPGKHMSTGTCRYCGVANFVLMDNPTSEFCVRCWSCKGITPVVVRSKSVLER